MAPFSYALHGHQSLDVGRSRPMAPNARDFLDGLNGSRQTCGLFTFQSMPQQRNNWSRSLLLDTWGGQSRTIHVAGQQNKMTRYDPAPQTCMESAASCGLSYRVCVSGHVPSTRIDAYHVFDKKLSLACNIRP